MLHHKGVNKRTNVLGVHHLNCENKRTKFVAVFHHNFLNKGTKVLVVLHLNGEKKKRKFPAVF